MSLFVFEAESEFVLLKVFSLFLFQNAKAHQQLLEQHVFSLVSYFNSMQDQAVRQGKALFTRLNALVVEEIVVIFIYYCRLILVQQFTQREIDRDSKHAVA